jgi:hypothetical protein
MSRVSNLIKEIRDRLNELESLNHSSFQEITAASVDISANNFRISDSLISFNKTDFQISKPKLIELCNLIVNHTGSEINIKPFVETIDPNRCNSYCIVKEIPRREKFLKEDENLYYDLLSKKYYSQCRMPKDKCNNYCARHTGITQTDVSNMKILTDSKYILLLDILVKEYCKMYLSRLAPVSVDPTGSVDPVDPVVAVAIVSGSSVKKVSTSSVKKVSTSSVKKVSASIVKKVSAPILPSKAKEPLSSESEVESDSDSSVSEVDMIVSKVSESLKPSVSLSPSSESESDPEDSDDCMLDADEIHDEDGKTYYIDESKSVIELDDDGYGVKIGILKELKSGSIFYKNKRWKIDYFPKK